jgi:hypothetical protein
MVGYSLSGGLVMRRREFITVLGGAAAIGLPSVQSALGSCQSCDRLSCACRSVWSEKVSLSDPVSLCHNQL